MKKGILVFTVVLLFAVSVPRPVVAAIDFDWGIKGGLSLASEKWSDDSSASKLMGKPVFGAFLSFSLNESFAIQPEVYYLTRGGIYSYESEGTTYKWEDTQNYLHVPVLAKIRLMPNGKLTPIIFAGPAVGFLLSAHEKYYADGVLEWDKAVKTWYKSTNFSVVFGGGLEYKLDKLMLVLDIRYDLGLTNVDLSDSPTADTLKTSALMFMLGVGF